MIENGTVGSDQGDMRMEASPTKQSEAKLRILRSAARLFRRQGYTRTTVRQLASDVGIQSGSLFHHFKTKDDILFAVMDQVITDMDTRLEAELKNAQTLRGKLRALFHVHLTFLHLEQSDATAVLVYEWSALPPDRQALLLERRQRYFDRWTAVLMAANDKGLLKVDPTLLRQLLHGATVWTAHWYDPKGSVSVADLENALVEMAIR